jgi:hypothetical protein
MYINKNIKRAIDNLSYKYEFFYLIKTNKIKSALFSLIYILFVFYILAKIHSKDDMYGIISNIFPFFVDVAIVFSITVVFLVIRSLHNDEKGRINEKDNFAIHTVIPLNLKFSDVKIIFDIDSFYYQPKHIETFLKWVDFDKDDYFRTHYGSLDIPKLVIKNIFFESERLHITCSSASFYDISFTHYFPDYPLSSSRSKSQETTVSLRSLLSDDIEKHYDKIHLFNEKKFSLYELLPNPMGITGIVELSIEGYKSLYILQARLSADAAAKDKIQHAFAGTIDSFPNMNLVSSCLEAMVNTELYDEVIHQTIGNGMGLNKLEDCESINRTNTLLGITINPLYLYQPELFVKVNYAIPKLQILMPLIEQLKKEELIFSECLNKNKKLPKRKSNLYICCESDLHKLLHSKKLITRNLFPVGLDLLEIHNKL